VKQFSNKSPKFFCDNCGAEVAGNVKACPSCGRFFVSVRCPACGFSGEERIFAKGCPACGYSATPGGMQPGRRKAPIDPLPYWVYVVSIIALLCVFAALFFLLMR
jgi:predicted RNA-binding Zn-ribbon protein involved in translation (DUF1610 family)